MRPTIRLTAMPDETHFAPLGVLGYCLTRTHFLEPVFESVRLPFKTVVHSPTSKLLDVLVSILAGCRAIRQVNTRLRPDLALAQAWGRERFAEQATLARTLDGFTVEQIAQLRHGSERLFRRESRTLRHPFAEDWLWLDIDLTPLPASKHAEASTKGKLGAKKTSMGGNWRACRRRSITKRCFPSFYPGKQASSPTYLPVVQAIDAFLGLRVAQKARTILRSDAGFGSDANVAAALAGHWQVVTKSGGGRRPAALARQVRDDGWLELRPNDRWVAPVQGPVAFERPVQWLALRWRTQHGQLKHSTVVCSVSTWSPAEVIAYYDARGACETEIQADKGGLLLSRRRKKVLAAQETLVLLTDLAHNLLAWATPWMFPAGPLAQFGPTQLIQDVLTLPGHLIFHHQQLAEVHLNVLHPYAAEVAAGLERLLDRFGSP